MEENKIIAEFMDGKLIKDIQTNFAGKADGWQFPNKPSVDYMLEYHTSWDWLMPVVEKIESIGSTTVLIHSDTCEIYCTYSGQSKFFNGEVGKPKIERLYQAIMKFIHWYNQALND